MRVSMYPRNSCPPDLCQNLAYYAARSPAFSLLPLPAQRQPIRKPSHFEFLCVGKEYGLFRKQAVSYTHFMNSNFYYPTNTGSLGEPRRANRFMSSIRHRTSAHFEADAVRIPPNAAKPTILVVEDDHNSRSALKTLLRPKGYRVLEAWDGKQAIEVVTAEKLDLILLDLQLPKLDGLGVIRHLRENLNLNSLPIVMMTACDSESRGSAMACGCDDFLPKPIDFDRLQAVLDHFVPL